MEVSGVAPDDGAVSTLVVALARLGDPREAQALFERCETEYGVRPTLHAYTAMIAAYGAEVQRQRIASSFLIALLTYLGQSREGREARGAANEGRTRHGSADLHGASLS